MPDQKEQLGKDSYALEFADPDSVIRRRFIENGYTGITLAVRLVFRKADGEYHLTPLDVYTGQCSAPMNAVTNDGAITTITFLGQMASLRLRLPILTPADQIGRLSTDNSLLYVTAQRPLKWGGR